MKNNETMKATIDAAIETKTAMTEALKLDLLLLEMEKAFGYCDFIEGGNK